MTKKVEYGTSVHLSSGNGNILAVGAPHHGYISSTADPTQVNTDGGGVFLYRYDGSDWSLLSIIAGLPSEQIGGNLAVSSDGSRIAIRRNKALSLYLNEVEVYNVGVSGVPTKVGSDLSCGGRGDSMSLSSDGSRIVVSCHGINGGRGLVEIFDWTDGEWSSIGRLSVANTSEINNNDRFGWVVSLDDGGNRLAVSAPNYDVDGMSDRGLVRVYEYANGSWDQIGGDIVGSTAEEVFGYAMDISGKGLSVAVGAYVRSVGGVSGAGTVSVFSLPPDGTTWVPVGQLVTGGASQQRFGRSVSISTDGKRVAASSRGPSSRGLVQLLDFNGTQWEISGELLGVRNQERLGYALEGVTLTGDGNRVACGSVWGNNTAGLLTGSVRVFNNLKASGAPSLSPSVAVSVAPTGIPSVVSSSTPTVLISTAIPTTMAPSSFPVTPFKCGQYLDSNTSGFIMILKSNASTLCTLVEVTSSGFLKPVARSYDAFDWEAAPGDYSSMLNFQCSMETCTVDLPVLASGSIYHMKYFGKPSYSRSDESARFLEQATFGPTRSGINTFNTGNLGVSFANWIKQQQTMVPLTSHREFFRKHLNSRFDHSTPMSVVTHACQTGTRYRRYAFSNKDKRFKIVVETLGKYKIISINNITRTVVEGPITYIDRDEKKVELQDGR